MHSMLLTHDLKGIPDWLPSSVVFEGIGGSRAYGVADKHSDYDVWGYCVPPATVMFPLLGRKIPGFESQLGSFEQYLTKELRYQGQETDYTCYGILKLCRLALEGNPNVLEVLFLPQDLHITTSPISRALWDSRHIFLHQGCWRKHLGYAESQMHKLANKHPEPGTERYQRAQEMGYDTKYAMHAVRLLLQGHQILANGTMDLRANSELLLDIRSGHYNLPTLKGYFEELKQRLMEQVGKSDLPSRPRENEVRNLLWSCLEHRIPSLAMLKGITFED